MTGDSVVLAAAVTAGFTFLGTIATLVVGLATKRRADEVNDAVNHRHPTGKRLYDLAVENHQRVGKIEEDVGDVKRRVARIESNCPNCPAAKL